MEATLANTALQMMTISPWAAVALITALAGFYLIYKFKDVILKLVEELGLIREPLTKLQGDVEGIRAELARYIPQQDELGRKVEAHEVRLTKLECRQ